MPNINEYFQQVHADLSRIMLGMIILFVEVFLDAEQFFLSGRIEATIVDLLQQIHMRRKIFLVTSGYEQDNSCKF